GETLGLVGESGCGKTTLVRTMLRLTEPTAGEMVYDGEDFLRLNKKELKEKRKDMQIVFQDPFGSLHPKMKIRTILEEPLIINKYGDKETRAARVRELMELVDLKEEQLDRYPHEFSGGQRQRIVIARALATNPAFVVCDEPVSALDVSVRSQILNLLNDLQEKFQLTYLFISHDLSVVEHICDRVVVMYLGKVVEMATREQLFRNPLHPYTQALFSAVPQVNPEKQRERIPLEGDIPSPADPPPGCHFHGRCRYACEECRSREPELVDLGDGHLVACHRCINKNF
ncbi:MAG: dipeptide ABC transporter ATP-binding protein, partial [Lachnospiraceae bacterium]|nr:dipeptide ABC transporter ATP-binding protein [Lachnospiraceae bacterium]